MPKVRLALVSDDFRFEEGSISYSIIRAFETRYAPSFPFHKRFFVIVYWEALSLGETFEQSITILDRDSKARVGSTPARRVQINNPKHMIVNEFPDVVFDKAGTYTVNIHADGVLVEQVPLIVVQLNLHS